MCFLLKTAILFIYLFLHFYHGGQHIFKNHCFKRGTCMQNSVQGRQFLWQCYLDNFLDADNGVGQEGPDLDVIVCVIRVSNTHEQDVRWQAR